MINLTEEEEHRYIAYAMGFNDGLHGNPVFNVFKGMDEIDEHAGYYDVGYIRGQEARLNVYLEIKANLN